MILLPAQVAQRGKFDRLCKRENRKQAFPSSTASWEGPRIYLRGAQRHAEPSNQIRPISDSGAILRGREAWTVAWHTKANFEERRKTRSEETFHGRACRDRGRSRGSG